MGMLNFVRVMGILVLLSIACSGEEEVKDFLSDLEKRIEAFKAAPAKESSRSSSKSSSGRAPQIAFKTPSILASPIASNLAKLISNALGTGDDVPKEVKKEDLSASLVEKKVGGGEEEDGEEEGLEDVTTPYDVRIDSREDSSGNATNVSSNSSRTDGDKVDYVPASAEQFGELGTGSKLMEYLPDFSQMSIETGDFASLAGIGLAGLMAATAVFAVPVAPVILRRTGNNGWAGLPSWSDLFSWWTTPEPSAEAWVDKHNQGYDYRYDYDTGAYTHNGQQYYAYDTTGSGSEHSSYYAETDTNRLQYAAAPAEEEQEEPQGYDAHTNAAYGQLPQYMQQQQQHPEAYNVHRRNRRPSTGVDGHEYVTLEQLNRIGEESVKYLSEIAKGYTAEDFYAYRDNVENNELKRRRLQAPESPANGRNPSRPQYQPQPSYLESQQHFTQSYLTQDKMDDGPEGFPHKDAFSITQPDSKEDANYESRSPYVYHSKNNGKDSSSEDGKGEKMEKQMFKVSEFPYNFERK